MKTFLVPISSLKEKKATLIYAIDFAKAVGAEMIYGIQLTEIDEKDHLEKIIEHAKSQGIDINFRFYEGETIEYIKEFCEDFKVDLVVASARTPKTNEKLYLDDLSGSIVRKTDMPVLLIPEDYKFETIATVLTAIKSGIVKTEEATKPIETILLKLKAQMTLLQVKTPEYLPEDLMFDKDLAALTSKYYSTENATLFQGVLEYIHVIEPDLICVFRRKRGFFQKLWSETVNDNSVRKSDFESRKPLLVLKGEQ
ncbi:universal stress protein [Lacinutrix sp. Bg11-31]|uniref:universal stress protein n=1 Tax=Lacinutrix sp. Bg11-31 TaxID=2057808 RepID=UPI000C317071|nr:universal stress protein [Lacinutrix sp. Bg11-31]AUC81858.1 universal stress protein UspA [Lacinutrix sp. Bg11-31]